MDSKTKRIIKSPKKAGGIPRAKIQEAARKAMLEPKADEEGLLTDEDALRAMYPHSYHSVMKLSLPEKRLCKAQAALTSRLKEAKCAKALDAAHARDFRDHAWESKTELKEECHKRDKYIESLKESCAMWEELVDELKATLKAECQKRVEEVFEAIEACGMNMGHRYIVKGPGWQSKEHYPDRCSRCRYEALKAKHLGVKE